MMVHGIMHHHFKLKQKNLIINSILIKNRIGIDKHQNISVLRDCKRLIKAYHLGH